MRAHRRKLHRKSRFLLPSRKWTTGFGLLRKLCFPQWQHLQLKKKKQTANLVKCARCYSSRQNRVQLLHRKRVSSKGCHLKKHIFDTNYIAYNKRVHEGIQLLKAAAQSVVSKDETEDQSLRLLKKKGSTPPAGINVENGLTSVTSLGTHSINGHTDNIQCSAYLAVSESSLSSDDQKGAIPALAVLNGSAGKNSRAVQHCVLNSSSYKSRTNFFQCSKKRSSLFMMYKELSMFKFRCGSFKPPFRSRNKTIKLRKSNRSWFQKVTKGFGKNRNSVHLEPDVCNLFACLTVHSDPIVHRQPRSPDMNSHISRLLSEAKECLPDGHPRTECLTLQSSERQLEEAIPQRQPQNSQNLHNTATGWECSDSLTTEEDFDVAPVVNNCLADIFVLVTDKEDSVSCRGSTALDEISDGGKRTLDSSMGLFSTPPLNMGLSSTLFPNMGVSNTPTPSMRAPRTPPPVSVCVPFLEHLEQHVAQIENTCQMEIDECTNSAFSSKLPFEDHLYCKRPHEEPSPGKVVYTSENPEVETKTEKHEAGGKNIQKLPSLVPDLQLSSRICEFLDETVKKYGSLIPLSERDVFAKLKEVFNEDFSNRKTFITKEIMKYRAKNTKVAVSSFRVFYNKHMLDMDDLATLDGQNWLNDQVINMYGELITDAVPDKVHFFNSFFHRQLVTKGYNGVKRWTKKVDLFKKTLLLIPIHLEVHWSLITVNLPDRIISFYDSQGIHFKFCVENIRKYLSTEAKEKNNPEFLQGWQTAVTQCIPQQKNDSDCGVFVLQYCKCLALGQPFQFSQDDMPRVRKRIYKELCECRLMD